MATTAHLRAELTAMWDDLEARGALIDRTRANSRRSPGQLRALLADARERRRVLASPEAHQRMRYLFRARRLASTAEQRPAEPTARPA